MAPAPGQLMLQTVRNLPTILIVRARSNRELFTLALELGNLHVPVEVTTDAVLVQADGPVEEILERMNLTWETKETQ